MTTIIISVLCALGIGGGVMLSSSGGSSSGGAAIVAPANPNGNGGGSTTGGTTTGGSSNTGGTTTGGGTTGGTTTGSSNVGSLLASGSLSGITVMGRGAAGNTTLNGKNLTIGMAPYAPILVSGTNYKTNEEYDVTAINYLSGGKVYSSNAQFVSGYTLTSPVIKQTINLSNIEGSNNYVDFYSGPGTYTKVLPSLTVSYLKGSSGNSQPWYGSIIGPTTYNNVTWEFFIQDFALGARKLGLKNSEFGYYNWQSKFVNVRTVDGGDSFYMFRTANQFTGSNYVSRYGNTATFEGNVIGVLRTVNYVCGSGNTQEHVTGDISLVLNLSNKTLTGNITNTKISTYSHGSSTSQPGIWHIHANNAQVYDWYDFTLTGVINNATSGSPNIVFTNVDYDRAQTDSVYSHNTFDGTNLHPLNNSTNFGDAVIVKGSSVSQDEMVGQIKFTGHRLTSGTDYFTHAYLSFGAKKK